MNRRYYSYQNNRSQHILLALLALAIFMLSGCATTRIDEEGNEVKVVDPYENINRKVYAFNDVVDNYVAEPISDAYKYVTPQFVQTGVANFFSNLKEINTVLNDVLQAKFGQGAQDTGRFALNSTLGLLGLFDVATEVGLERHEEDFDQTLAVWGVPQGSYLVLPLLGPTTSRGIPGSVFDTAANPASYVGAPVQLVQMLNARANAEGALKFIDEAALDPYVFTRESFLQWRNFMINDGVTELENDDLYEFEDELMEDDENGSADPESAPASEVSEMEAAEDDKQQAFNLKLTSEEGENALESSSQPVEGQVQDQVVEPESVIKD
ncbi:MAG: MlaA family lipoprotein [Gammaproteobacteria bacterium]